MSNKFKAPEHLSKKTNIFIDKLESNMYYKKEHFSDFLNFDWIKEIDDSLVYLDNIFRAPKVVLKKEKYTVNIEKAKKTSVASIKNLSKNTNYIDKINPVTNDVQPSKLLIEQSEETFNTYENRFIYTLIRNLVRFVIIKEEELNNFKMLDDKTLEYIGTTNNGQEKFNIELKITANQYGSNNDKIDKNLEKNIENAKKQIEKINMFINSWKKTEMYKALDKAKVPLVHPPIKKTNLIAKNPNFQVAEKLWSFIQQSLADETEISEDGLETDGNDFTKDLLDDAFLTSYFVFDSITKLKREERENIKNYALVMIRHQIKRTLSILLKSGVKISEEEILKIILEELEKEKEKDMIDTSRVKTKFKSALDEYLEQTKDIF